DRSAYRARIQCDLCGAPDRHKPECSTPASGVSEWKRNDRASGWRRDQDDMAYRWRGLRVSWNQGATALHSEDCGPENGEGRSGEYTIQRSADGRPFVAHYA